MTRSNWLWGALALLLLAPGCGKVASQETAMPPRELGLEKTDIHEVPAPAAVAFDRSEPGEKPPSPRIYPGSPPLVPHGIADFLPITREQNFCIDCHQVAEKLPGEPTPIPRSHFVDLRRAPDVVLDRVAGARFKCTACHVPQTGAGPLVANTFGKED